MFILPHGTWRYNIRSVNLDWRQRPDGHSSRPVSSSCVFSGRCTTSQKGSPPQKKDICELSLTVFLLHTIVAVEEWKYRLYFNISTSRSLFYASGTICDISTPRKFFFYKNLIKKYSTIPPLKDTTSVCLVLNFVNHFSMTTVIKKKYKSYESISEL